MAATIDFEGTAMVHMEARSFMWVSVKAFRVDMTVSDTELISALIAHRQYCDHYAGQTPEEQAQDDLHGPYWLRAISLKSFEPVAADVAKAVMQGWADSPEPQDREAQQRLETEVFPLLDVAALYRLKDLRATAEHEWGWVVGQGGFHEFVAIDRRAEQLRLIVASDD